VDRPLHRPGLPRGWVVGSPHLFVATSVIYGAVGENENEDEYDRDVMNFVVYAVAMLYFAAAIGFILGVVSEAEVAMAYAMYIATAGPAGLP